MNLKRFFLSFGNSIRENRIAAGLSQAELATRSNVSISMIKRIESGANCGLRDVARVMVIVNPKLSDRVFQSMAFDVLDFTDNPHTGIDILAKVRNAKRIHSHSLKSSKSDEI